MNRIKKILDKAKIPYTETETETEAGKEISITFEFEGNNPFDGNNKFEIEVIKTPENLWKINTRRSGCYIITPEIGCFAELTRQLAKQMR